MIYLKKSVELGSISNYYSLKNLFQICPNYKYQSFYHLHGYNFSLIFIQMECDVLLRIAEILFRKR